jgi:hypothetical protein
MITVRHFYKGVMPILDIDNSRDSQFRGPASMLGG